MSKPGTAKEALLAELLGDVQTLLTHLEQADQSAMATAMAVNEASEKYREQMDVLVKTMRTEMASIVLKTTEHAANSLVGQQQETLGRAATEAVKSAITAQAFKRYRKDWFIAVGMSATIGAVIGAAMVIMV